MTRERQPKMTRVQRRSARVQEKRQRREDRLVSLLDRLGLVSADGTYDYDHVSIVLAFECEARQRGRREALNGMALKCKRNIEAGMNVEFYQDVLRLVDDARIERAREARARGRKR